MAPGLRCDGGIGNNAIHANLFHSEKSFRHIRFGVVVDVVVVVVVGLGVVVVVVVGG